MVSIPDGGSLDDASVYVDGKVEITTGSSSATLNSASNSTFTIGVDADGNHFKGYIDDVWTWSRPLAASEVDKLYEDERPKAPPEPDVLRPVITANPVHATVAEGDDATFAVTADGKPDPTYQWQTLSNRKWIDIKDATESTLNIVSSTAVDANSYRVVVRNSEGYRNSKTAKLSVMAKPAFVVQPVDASYVTGSSVNILLNVAGGRGMTYEWFKDGASIGTTRSNKLSLKKVKASNHDGIYSVTVTNQVGEVTSDDFSVTIIEGSP